ncbi:hypothetical protein HDU97_005962 [Phlyctochytrium planicorne]|nr:hypothetical protein HDU97_005962 [Phlyctochytrium planicorne]
MSIRLELKISHSEPRTNVFNCQELLRKAAPPQEPTRSKPEAPSDGNGLGSSVSGSGDKGEGKEGSSDDDMDEDGDDSEKKKKRIDPTNEYDMDDDFIDDSELFLQDGAMFIPTTSSYGYFAWRGPIETFFDEFAPELLESPKPSLRKKRTQPSAKGKKAESKGAAPSEKDKGGAQSGPESQNNEKDNATAPDASAPIPTIVDASAVVSETNGTPKANGEAKKRKKSPVKEDGEKKRRKQDPKPPQKAGDVEKPAEASSATTASTPAPPSTVSAALPSPAASKPPESVSDQHDGKESKSDSEKKKKKKKAKEAGDEPAFAPETMEKLNLLREEAKKVSIVLYNIMFQKRFYAESFEVKRHFPPQLKPLLHTAAATAMPLNQLDLNFVKYIREFLPYNTYTLKKLVAKMLLREGIVVLQNEIEKAYPEIQKKVTEACSAQGIDGPLEAPPPTTQAAPLPQPTEGSAEETPPANATPTGDATETPKKKFKWSEELRGMVWNILIMECELAEFFNNYNQLEGESTKQTDMGVRKVCYAKLLANWMD